MPRQCAHWLAMTEGVGSRCDYRTSLSFRGSIATVGIRIPTSVKGERYMKATGIVRRVEECVIIGQKLKKPHKH